MLVATLRVNSKLHWQQWPRLQSKSTGFVGLAIFSSAIRLSELLHLDPAAMSADLSLSTQSSCVPLREARLLLFDVELDNSNGLYSSGARSLVEALIRRSP